MAAEPSIKSTKLERGSQIASNSLGPLFPYIWKNSRQQQIFILVVVIFSLPFYFMSLDLPRAIVNDAIEGKAFKNGNVESPLINLSIPIPHIFGDYSFEYHGIYLPRIEYLLAISSIFMVLVLINGAFRYVINMQKGKLGERLLRRLRLDLFNLLLRFSPEAIRTVRSAEVATIIRDEVEPIGGFVGDAFIQPAFLGGQAVTALAFIIIQSPVLGLLAALMVLVQGVMIPRLRREQLRLGRQRQVRSRTLAGHVGEIVDGMSEVSNHGTGGYEKQKIINILDDLFWIRYDLYGRKFMVKFVNSVLAQITPFLFYSIGGYFALRGSLDIGQLVAVIAAYRDLPPPIKELIDWDQQRLDVEVKYNQILEQFSLAEMPPATGNAPVGQISGAIEIESLKVRGPTGDFLLNGVNLILPLGTRILLTGSRGEAFAVLAQVLARRLSDYDGKVRIAGHDSSQMPGDWFGANVAYLGPDSSIFAGSLRHNFTYSLLRTSRAAHGDSDHAIADKASVGEENEIASTLDFRTAGAAGPEELDDLIVVLLRDVGLFEAVYGFGLAARLPDGVDADLRARLVEARHALTVKLTSVKAAGLIEPFDPACFNHNATIGENIFFGVFRRQSALNVLIEDPTVRDLLDQEDLADDLVALGAKVAATMVEIFSQVSGDHHLFDRFSFVSFSDLPAFADIAARASTLGSASLNAADHQSLLTIALEYVESKHRLALLSEDLAAKIVRIRSRLMREAPAALTKSIEFYDPDQLCLAAPLRDNLLFGRVNHAIAGAEQRVGELMHAVLREFDLEKTVFRLGLDHEAGPRGRLALSAHRSAVGLVRCLIKRPSILIVDQPGLMFAEDERARIFGAIHKHMAGATFIVSARAPFPGTDFDHVVTTVGNRIESSVRPAAGTVEEGIEAEPGQDDQPEIQALRDVPIFAMLDTPRLKLIAFTSARVTLADGQILFREGDSADAAYIILSGSVAVFREGADGPTHLSTVGRHGIIGEMGLISGAPRSATIVAASDVTVLRINKDVFLDLLGELPSVALAIMREQIGRLNNAERRFGAGS
jgi:putative ABC transport system ATP-binding protein